MVQIINQVTLHIRGGRATFGDAGIELAPRLTHQRVQIPWANIMFVSPVPAVSRFGFGPDNTWRTFEGVRITPTSLRKTLKFYCIQVALHDRARLLESATTFTRMCLGPMVFPKPLYQQDDTPHPSNGSITLDLRQRWLRKNGSSLLAALDICERFSHFDLLVSFD
jgi:hypothetical protein